MSHQRAFPDDYANDIAEVVLKYSEEVPASTTLSALTRNLIAASRASGLSDAELVSAVRESCEVAPERSRQCSN